MINWIRRWRDARRRKVEEIAYRREVAQGLRMLAAEGRTIAIGVASRAQAGNSADSKLLELIESKCQFLDELAGKTERGEVELNEEWPEVVGG